jgi:hypothetical protein
MLFVYEYAVLLRFYQFCLPSGGTHIMSKKKQVLLSASIFGFIGLLLLAVYFESEQFIYIASALPIVIVMLLPDIRQDQYVTVKKKSSGIELTKQLIGEEPMLVVSLQPKAVKWSNRRLFLRFSELSNAPVSTSTQGATSLAVLPFDLVPHPNKADWIGIDLAQLRERTRSLSYSPSDVTRMTIKVSDLNIAAMHMVSKKNNTSTKAGSKSLQA